MPESTPANSWSATARAKAHEVRKANAVYPLGLHSSPSNAHRSTVVSDSEQPDHPVRPSRQQKFFTIPGSVVYQAKPTEEQKSVAANQLDAVAWTYNWAVNRIRDATAGSRLGEVPSCKQLTAEHAALKKSESGGWLKTASSVALQQSISHAHDAHWKHLKSKGTTHPLRPPALKEPGIGQRAMKYTKAAARSFEIESTGPRSGLIHIPKLGKVKIATSQPLPFKVSSMIFKRDTDGRYFVIFVGQVATVPSPVSTQICGVDLGLTRSAAVVSFDHQTGQWARWEVSYQRQTAARFRKIEREKAKLSRMVNGSANYKKQFELIAGLHKKQQRRRKDFDNKLAVRLCRENEVIVIEDLETRSMDVKSARKAGMRSFRTHLMHQALKRGRKVVVISRFAPTTQQCSNCEHRDGKKAPGIRSWICPKCHSHLDRDYNAAVNIVKLAGCRAESLNARAWVALWDPVREALGPSSMLEEHGGSGQGDKLA